MTFRVVHRAWSPAVILLLLLPAGSGVAPVAAESHCQVSLGRGWAGGNGQGTIVMRNTGQPCGTALYSDPEAGIFVDVVHVTTRPQHGVVSIEVPRFFYAPNRGYTGQDRFAVTAEGPDRNRRQRITLSGEVTVRVSP